MIQVNFSPKAVLWGPTGASQWFYNAFEGALEGIMFEGAWSVNSSPAAKAYYEKLAAASWVRRTVDFWGGLIYRAQLEALQQAIEQAATLDQAKIADSPAEGALQDVYERRLLLRSEPDPQQGLPTPARSASGRRA